MAHFPFLDILERSFLTSLSVSLSPVLDSVFNSIGAGVVFLTLYENVYLLLRLLRSL